MTSRIAKRTIQSVRTECGGVQGAAGECLDGKETATEGLLPIARPAATTDTKYSVSEYGPCSIAGSELPNGFFLLKLRLESLKPSDTVRIPNAEIVDKSVTMIFDIVSFLNCANVVDR